jgi:ethanolaminephosphotransferase
MVAACGYGSTPLGLFTVLIPCAPMFFSSWEQFHTGTLYLGYFNGPCEGIIIACTLMGISAIYGPGFYHERAVDVIGWPFTSNSIMMYDLFVGMCLLGLFFAHIPSWYFSRRHS